MWQQRNLIIAGIVALIGLFFYWLLRPSPILVETATVRQQPFTIIVEADGRTRVRDRYVISAPLAGRVPRSSFREGDDVKVGQVLTTMAPNVSPLLNPRLRQELEERVGAAQAAVEEAAAMHARAKVVLTRARTDLERSKRLKERGIEAIAKFESYEFVVQSAEREVAAAEQRRHAAEHALAQARAALKRSSQNGGTERFPVSSPINGRVLKVVQKSEAAIAVGAPLLELGDPRNLEVIVDVLTNDAAKISEGASISFERWGGGQALEGRVRRIEPSGFTKVSALGVEEQRVWVVADITSPSKLWANLSDGYRIDLKIVVEEIDEALVVPVGALFRRGDDWFVFVVDGKNARLRRVEGLRRSGRMAAVATGLRSGEAVVVYPSGSLTNGRSVRLQ
ncbi:MAG: efflux RND transporter periplasmic adaptor subunit [Hyphomicrobiaceae bacterium]